jgi:hypothetical protein
MINSRKIFKYCIYQSVQHLFLRRLSQFLLVQVMLKQAQSLNQVMLKQGQSLKEILARLTNKFRRSQQKALQTRVNLQVIQGRTGQVRVKGTTEIAVVILRTQQTSCVRTLI